jgi:hypothetical protein
VQVMMTEEDMHEQLDLERERVDRAQQAQLIAEKALQDALSVNTSLQKQVRSFDTRTLLQARATSLHFLDGVL